MAGDRPVEPERFGHLGHPEANPYAFLAYQGSSPHVRLRAEPDCVLLSAASDARPFNTLFAPGFAEPGLDDRVREVARAHTPPGRTAVWWIGPSATPAGLPHRLARSGFTPLPAIRLMSADLADRPPPPTGARVRPVRTDTELTAFADVLAAAYGSPPRYARFTHHVLASLPRTEDAPLRHFVLRVGSVAVAVASTFRRDGAVGLYNVATRPDARGRGYGTEVTRAALADAYDRGARLATLGAEPAATGLYARLGFVPCGTLERVAFTPCG